jgi:hypothetical protein
MERCNYFRELGMIKDKYGNYHHGHDAYNRIQIGIAGEDIKKGDVISINMNFHNGNQIIYKARKEDIK